MKLDEKNKSAHTWSSKWTFKTWTITNSVLRTYWQIFLYIPHAQCAISRCRSKLIARQEFYIWNSFFMPTKHVQRLADISQVIIVNVMICRTHLHNSQVLEVIFGFNPARLPNLIYEFYWFEFQSNVSQEGIIKNHCSFNSYLNKRKRIKGEILASTIWRNLYLDKKM